MHNMTYAATRLTHLTSPRIRAHPCDPWFFVSLPPREPPLKKPDFPNLADRDGL